MPFPYKTVLITGATSGIGRALAERMVENGVFVVAVGRRQDRLNELVAKHGARKIAVECFDVGDIKGLEEWSKKMTSTYPELDCIVLNAGIQRPLDFTAPATISLQTVDEEITTNYISPVHTITHFLPHLTSLSSETRPTAIVLVSSGIGLIPFPQVPNYAATKAALHSLAWTLRAQLTNGAATQHVRVIEVVPPAVQTELHGADGGHVGMPLAECTDEIWAGLQREDAEIPVGAVKERFYPVDVERRARFHSVLEMYKMQIPKL